MNKAFFLLLLKGTHHQKYAKWKAAYIHKCLKSGETPIPGPAGGEDESFNEQEGGATANPPSTSTQQPQGYPGYPTNTQQPPYPTGNTAGIPGQFPSPSPYSVPPAQPSVSQVIPS